MQFSRPFLRIFFLPCFKSAVGLSIQKVKIQNSSALINFLVSSLLSIRFKWESYEIASFIIKSLVVFEILDLNQIFDFHYIDFIGFGYFENLVWMLYQWNKFLLARIDLTLISISRYNSLRLGCENFLLIRTWLVFPENKSNPKNSSIYMENIYYYLPILVGFHKYRV